MTTISAQDFKKMPERILHLTLKKQWFDMIASGEKKEEYREIKPYWFMRLIFEPNKVMQYNGITNKKEINQYCVDRIINNKLKMYGFKPFDFIVFRNGYSKNAPTIKLECKGIEIGNARPEWSGLLWDKMFVIKLGEIIK